MDAMITYTNSHDPATVFRQRLIDPLPEWAVNVQDEPVALVVRNDSGQIYLQAPDGGPFFMNSCVGQSLYTTPRNNFSLLACIDLLTAERDSARALCLSMAMAVQDLAEITAAAETQAANEVWWAMMTFGDPTLLWRQIRAVAV